MKKYKELTFWENSYRQKTLKEYQEKVEEYFRLVEYDYDRNIIDSNQSKIIRTYLNKSTMTPKIFGNEPGKALTLVENRLFPAAKIKNLKLISIKQVGDELFLRYRIIN